MISPKKFKLARRLGAPIFEKCNSPKFSPERPRRGKSGAPRRPTDYSRQLTEKQKVRFYYYVSERQFKNYVNKAMESAHPARALFELLESRLDSITHRSGFAPTRQAARQMVSHGHLMVNNRRTTVPSMRISVGDVITFREGSRSRRIYTDAVDRTKEHRTPGWMAMDATQMKTKITGVPTDPDAMLDFQSVIEFYSR